MEAEVLPYHWDDRAKLHANYRDLSAFYERLLSDLAAQLNLIHGVDHSHRYWRILIGPWLGYFVQILFDRYESIHQALGLYELNETITLTGREEDLTPHDMDHFISLFVGDDWNHHIYSMILQQFTQVQCITKPRQGRLAESTTPSSPPLLRGVAQKIAEYQERGTRFLGGEHDAFLLATYLPIFDELKLHLLLGQIPIHSRSEPLTATAPIDGWRQWVVPGDNRSEFESCARTLIARQIPTAYLEGYARLVEQAARMPWPKHPKVIWTSNAHNSDEVFKAWAASNAENGVPIVIGQHGGHDGTGLWSFTEEHKIAISDCYLSWGWSESTQPKVQPLGLLKSKHPLNVKHSGQTNALLVTTTVPRQSYHLFSIMVSRQWLDYFDDHCSFVRNLPPIIRKALLVRLYPQDYGWDQAARWKDQFPDVRLDGGESSMDSLLCQSRLYIATYNATAFLESFAMDIPTIIYWNPAHSELRDSATPYFEGLRRVGIYHDTPEGAARQAAMVWDDIDAWWDSPTLRHELTAFKNRYCHSPENLLNRLGIALRRIAADSRSATRKDIH